MPIWELLVDLVGQTLFVLAQLFSGSTGAAIAMLSIAVRVALLPLTVRLGVQMRRLRSRMDELRPDVERLRRRYASDRARFTEKVGELYARNGIRLLPRGSLLTVAVQLPIGLALYQAIASSVVPGSRFLWVADLARPDAFLSLATAALTGIGTAVASTSAASASAPHSQSAAVIVSAVVVLAVVWRVAAGVAIYWAASSAVGIAQGWIIRRLAPAKPPEITNQ